MKHILTLTFSVWLALLHAQFNPFVCSTCLTEQDTAFFDSTNMSVDSREFASWFEVMEYDSLVSIKAELKQFYVSGQIKLSAKFMPLSTLTIHDTIKAWYPNGQLHYQLPIRDNVLNGKIQMFWENGKPKREEQFSHNKFISGKIWNEQGVEEPFHPVLTMPQFDGGEQELFNWIGTNIEIPEQPEDLPDGDHKVIVNFTINPQGWVKDVYIKSGIHQTLDSSAIDVIQRMPQWIPGSFDNHSVWSSYNLPVRFVYLSR